MTSGSSLNELIVTSGGLQKISDSKTQLDSSQVNSIASLPFKLNLDDIYIQGSACKYVVKK